MAGWLWGLWSACGLVRELAIGRALAVIGPVWTGATAHGVGRRSERMPRTMSLVRSRRSLRPGVTVAGDERSDPVPARDRRPVSACAVLRGSAAAHEVSCQKDGRRGAGRGRMPRMTMVPPQHGQRSSGQRGRHRSTCSAPDRCRRRVEQLAAERQLLGAMAVGEEAVVADAMEAVRQGVQQEAADELVGGEGHHLRLAVMAIVPPAEGDLGRRSG